MALLKLKDIGKIYVSEENVSVGIRGVNLSFEKGEFVAITGESGSGKSTLLNVISGMDTYEEGELYINDEPTSHFIQEDWEEYRKENISFIFQNYNIIDSFTVLENVELALMHIENPIERKNRALELIERVGLKSHINHKGSKLSGGQKQRTVIARALAKESPIILADEPTGNLDSKTSKEIIELLKEVSKDKLLIIVTHDFDEVKDHATRHIRVFNGLVEFDSVIKESEKIEEKECKDSKNKGNKLLSNGLHLGKVLFKSKPRLSSFLSLLLFIGLVAIFFITSLFDLSSLYPKDYMFTPIEGRLVIASRSGKPITDEELEKIVDKYGAEYSIHYDLLLDNSSEQNYVYYNELGQKFTNFDCTYTFDKHYGNNILGSYPSKDNQVFLYLPIYKQEIFGKDQINIKKINVLGFDFEVSGIKYFYDNNKSTELLFTIDGFRLLTSYKYLNQGIKGVYLKTVIDSYDKNVQISDFTASFEVPKDKIYLNKDKYLDGYNINDTTKINFSATYVVYDNYFGNKTTYEFKKDFDSSYLISDVSSDELMPEGLVFNAHVMIEMVEEVLEKSYKQASVFFSSNNEARNAMESLKDEGYLAILSDTIYEEEGVESLISIILGTFMIVGWILAISFMAFFVNLCTNKSILSFKGDIAIMRSMGISKNVIKIGMYTRMLICLIPGTILTIIIALSIYLTPSTNNMLTYLYFYHYLLIFFGMLILTILTTRKQIRKLFNESVKKSLKGGDK